MKRTKVKNKSNYENKKNLINLIFKKKRKERRLSDKWAKPKR